MSLAVPGSSALIEDVKLCPIMSGQIAPVPSGGILPGGQSIQVAPVFLPCQREKCALWDVQAKGCSLAVSEDVSTQLGNIAGELTQIVEIFQHLQPPSHGKGYVARIADAVERFADAVGAKKGK